MPGGTPCVSVPRQMSVQHRAAWAHRAPALLTRLPPSGLLTTRKNAFANRQRGSGCSRRHGRKFQTCLHDASSVLPANAATGTDKPKQFPAA